MAQKYLFAVLFLLMAISFMACSKIQAITAKKPTCTNFISGKNPNVDLESAKKLKFTKKQIEIQIKMIEASLEIAHKENNTRSIAILECELEHSHYVASQLK